MKKSQITDKSGAEFEVYYLGDNKPQENLAVNKTQEGDPIILNEPLPAAGKAFEYPEKSMGLFKSPFWEKIFGSPPKQYAEPTTVELDDSLEKDTVSEDEELVFFQSYRIKGLNVVAEYKRKLAPFEAPVNYAGTCSSGELDGETLYEFKFCGVYFWVRRDMILKK